MAVYFAILGGALLVGLVLAAVHGAQNGWRFGRVFGRERLVDHAAPYRASVHREVTARGVPKTIWLASITSTVWGLVTLTIFFPAGGLLAVMLIGGAGGGGLPGLALLLICFSGLGLALNLFLSARRLLERSSSKIETIVRWSLAHHAIVLLYFTVLGAAFEQLEGFAVALLFVGVPCLVGVLQAMTLSAADQRLQRITKEEENGRALPPIEGREQPLPSFDDVGVASAQTPAG